MIIGFTGKAGSGKSTACKMVEEALEDTVRLNFKDALIKELRYNFPNLLSLLAEQYDEDIEWLFENKPPLMRSLMQNYGTNLRRGEKDFYWTEKWEEQVSENQQHHIVVDDVRFLNEARAVKDMGGIVVRIIRTDIVDTGTHVSETEMDKITPDYTIAVGPGEHEKLRLELNRIIQGVTYQ